MSDNDEDAGPGPNNYQFTPSTTDKIFNCGQCDFSYKTIKQIMVHVRSSPNHEAVCVQCNGRYKSFDKLRAHLRKILGPDLLIVCLTMSDSERRERVLARHQGDVSTADMMDVSRNVFRPDS